MYNTKEIREKLFQNLDVDCIENAVISNIIKKDEDKPSKVRVERIILKGEQYFQIASYVGQKVLHKNVKADSNSIIDEIIELMEDNFKQCSVTANKNLTILMNKKREFSLVGVKVNKNNRVVATSHNNEKNYILKNGEYVEWMYKLGLMTENGKVVNSKQKKFRQINKFLEMLKDIEGNLPENAEIIDMGCGKSYLTFAMYHYFNNIGPVSIA